MHQLLYVLVPTDEASTSEEARNLAMGFLDAEGFCGDSTLFRRPPADWFVIGGRYSGELTRLHLDRDKWRAYQRELNDWRGHGGSEGGKALFREIFPDFEGQLPIFRNDTYAPLGQEDDAQIVDEVLFRYLHGLLQYPLDTADILGGPCVVNLDDPYETVHAENIIGKSWVVVVDFHS